MNKKVTKVLAVTTGAAMFAGMFAAGVGAPAKQSDAYNTSTASGIGNFMSVMWDNATNVQVFKTDYGYGAWATDSNGQIIGNEPIAKTPYYIPTVGTAKRDTIYGDFVAAYEVNVANTLGGNTIQTYYDVADFATNVTDHFDHFANGLPIWENAYTAAAALDKNGGVTTPYIFSFEFGDYNENYVEFAGTTWNLANYNNKDKAFVDNSQIGVWTNTKLPDFSAGMDYIQYQRDFNGNIVKDKNGDPIITTYIPEVYMNPVFEDAHSLAWSMAEVFGTEPEDILANNLWDGTIFEHVYPGQIMPDANFDFEAEDGRFLGDWGNTPWWENLN